MARHREVAPPRVYTHQRTGVDWLQEKGFRGILADDMGLGKTRTATLGMRVAEQWPGLVLAPASTIGAWREELANWGIEPLEARNPRRRPGHRCAVVVSHHFLARNQALARLPWGSLIVDEAHEFKNPMSKRTRALLRCGAPVKLLLTGTPILNRREDMFVLLHLLDPDAFPDERSVLEASPAAIEPYLIRRTKRQVLELPDKTRVTHEVDLGHGRAVYDDAVENVEALAAASIRKKRIRLAVKHMRRARKGGLDMRAALERVLQAVNGPVDLTEAAEARAAALGHLRRALGRLKAPAVASWLSERRRMGPFVVFSEHKAPIAIVSAQLRTQGWKCAVLHGGLDQRKRTAMVAAFQAGRLDVLFCTKAGYAGITLTRARHLAFIEHWWVPAWEDQAEDRIHRIGQKRSVFIHRFHAPDTVDDHVLDLHRHKGEAMDEIVASDPVATKRSSAEVLADVSMRVAQRMAPRSLRVEISAAEVLAAMKARQR